MTVLNSASQMVPISKVITNTLNFARLITFHSFRIPPSSDNMAAIILNPHLRSSIALLCVSRHSLAMKSQSFGYVLLVMGFLVPSCSRQDTSTQTVSPNTNSQPILQQTFAPITGAFGWNLGERLHSETYEIVKHKDMMMISYTSERDSTILPFQHVIVCATKEGLIYEITGYIDPSQEEYSNVKKGIIDALASKYQLLPGYTPSRRYCDFGDKTNSVELEDCRVGVPPGYGLKLVYKNAPLYDALMSEATKTIEEEKIKKEQAIKDSFRGL